MDTGHTCGALKCAGKHTLLKSEGRPSGICEEGKGTKKKSRFLMLRNEKNNVSVY